MATQSQSAAAAGSENTRNDEDCSDESPRAAFLSRGCCCFWNFPRKSEDWDRISGSEMESPESGGRGWWWSGVRALMKVREWSEVVAGPKWKTFIRRFNRTGARSKAGKFQYDPMSYALNFDEGDIVFRDFSCTGRSRRTTGSHLKGCRRAASV